MDARMLLPLLVAAAGWLCSWPPADATCVLDSDFGFILNCGFKKSGLFRVRNLGGVKGYVGVGFSVGDELRFNESLSNVEPSNRRRAVAATARSSGAGPAPALAIKGAAAANATASAKGQKAPDRRRAQSIRQVRPTVPPFRPIAPAPPVPTPAAVSRPSRLAPAPPAAPAAAVVVPVAAASAAVPPFVALPPSISRVAGAVSAPAPAPAAAPAAPAVFRQALHSATHHFQVRKDVLMDPGVSANALGPEPSASGGGAVLPTIPPPPPPARPPTAAVPAAPAAASDAVVLAAAIQRLAQAANVSAEAVAAALAARRQQQQKQQLAAPASGPAVAAPAPAPAAAAAAVAAAPAPAAPADATPAPPSTTRSPLASLSKVMNAPREYYPVGYDKNFDDNFASRVELPDTSFYCGDQKHFPGLYGDEDLGCMVFHVCALTDDGLIMKSFLCPESTLFDQTILKCNWWFYVDCKASRKLYDSNIPISKSYQLMKALAFFSSYNKN